MNRRQTDTSIHQLIEAYEAQLLEGKSAFMDEQAFSQLIHYYGHGLEYEKALEIADQALMYHHFSIDFYLQKAEILLAMRHYESALALLQQAEPIAPNNSELALLRAEVLLYSGKPEEASNHLERLKNNADTALFCDICLLEAAIAEHRQEYESMFVLLKTALQHDSENEEVLEKFGRCIALTKRYEEGIAVHEAILEDNAYISIAWYNLGQAYTYLGKYEQATEAYELAYVIDEDFLEACKECADLFFETGQYDQALKYYEELCDRQDKDPDLYAAMGRCHYELRQYSNARAFFFKGIALDPLNDDLFYRIAECYMQDDKWLKAVYYLEKAIDVEAENETYFAALGKCFVELDQLEEARSALLEAVRINPEEYLYWMQLACLMVEIGENEAALETLDMGEEESGAIELMYCRVACLMAMGKPKQAQYWLNEALTEDFELHPILFEIAPQLSTHPSITAIIACYE
ncbi:MAG TPA: tetratricopeptide repeat protein [Saprospiraceae bacterium]|nr:tetratricopeptide repeat protein [Saprospiraceae bacterium]HMQ85623.1 tetratricopeptide repeat protein [Saprospiraceae bacterium]